MRKTTESRITLEELLKLKRHEAPKTAFWDKFERDFENRRLRALISAEEPSRMSWIQSGWRSLFWLGGSVAAAALAFVAINQTTFLAQRSPFGLPDANGPTELAEHAVAEDALVSVSSLDGVGNRLETVAAPVRTVSSTQPRFVRDVIADTAEQPHFRRILANPAFTGTRSAEARFVADTLTVSGRASATFLVDRPVGQF